jgi:hypothetical protein
MASTSGAGKRWKLKPNNSPPHSNQRFKANALGFAKVGRNRVHLLHFHCGTCVSTLL